MLLFIALNLLVPHIILYNKYQQMNNFNFCNNMYYQIWMVPNYVPSRPSYYSTVAFYPQLLRQQESNLIIQTPISYSNTNLPTEQPKEEPKPQVKQTRQQAPQKNEPQKLTIPPEITLSKQITKNPSKGEVKKANRPQTYLTEKAYYMKQKLKGKLINGNRILRRRLKLKQMKTVKVLESPKSNKKGIESTKALVKRLPIMRDSQKERKIVSKIRLKLAKQNHDQFAKIPRVISGVRQLNQFCRIKLENLMLRQIKLQ